MNANRLKFKMRQMLPSGLFHFISVSGKSIDLVRYLFQDYLFISNAIRVADTKTNNYELRLETHVIEKGLSHRKIRYGFGHARLERLAYELNRCLDESVDPETYEIQNALGVIKAYLDLHQELPQQVEFVKRTFGTRVVAMLQDVKLSSGAKYINKPSVSQKSDLEELLNSRFSLRDFSAEEPISKADVESAIQLAKRSPSSCNRQSVQVVEIYNGDLIKKLVKIQGGLDTTPQALLVVTSDITSYPNGKTRNLPYVDSGIFTMSLTLALQERNLGNAIINAALSRRDEQEIQRLLGVSAVKKITAFVAVGKLSDNMKVCVSNRTPLSETILKCIE